MYSTSCTVHHQRFFITVLEKALTNDPEYIKHFVDRNDESVKDDLRISLMTL